MHALSDKPVTVIRGRSLDPIDEMTPPIKVWAAKECHEELYNTPLVLKLDNRVCSNDGNNQDGPRP